MDERIEASLILQRSDGTKTVRLKWHAATTQAADESFKDISKVFGSVFAGLKFYEHDFSDVMTYDDFVARARDFGYKTEERSMN